MSGLQAKVTKAVQDKGYTITSSPDSAHYWIQANVLKADKMDLRTAGVPEPGLRRRDNGRCIRCGDHRL